MTVLDQAVLAEVKTIVTDMHHRLFGNGQPGIIATMESRLDELEAQKHRVEGAVKFLKFAAVITPIVAASGEALRLWLRG